LYDTIKINYSYKNHLCEIWNLLVINYSYGIIFQEQLNIITLGVIYGYKSFIYLLRSS
jgi:hypothetical protein